MDTKTILKEALQLRPAERLEIIQKLSQSLDKSDKEIEKIWAEESEKRYQALKNGKVDTITLDEIVKRYK